MKPIKGYSKVQASGEFERLAPGGYVIKITDVQDEDAPDKQYLRITYDIAEGPEAGHFKNTDAEHVFSHQFVRSYKEKALGMFKAFTVAVDESNGTKFTDQVEKGFNERQLIGKILGVVLCEEEYENNRGEVKTGLKVYSCMSADRIRQGEFKVPELKKLKQGSGSTTPAPMPEGFTPMTDDDLPF